MRQDPKEDSVGWRIEKAAGYQACRLATFGLMEI
jgi:hypothetical protein